MISYPELAGGPRGRWLYRRLDFEQLIVSLENLAGKTSRVTRAPLTITGNSITSVL